MITHSKTYFEILDCTRALVIAGGYSGFSYADISAFVGIRKASIHHHFPTKVDLVRTLVSQYRQEAQAGLEHLDRAIPDPAEQLRAYIGYWLECIGDATKGYCVCALLATQIPVLPEEIVVEVRAHFQMLSAWLVSVFERGAEQGRLVLPSDARSEAETFMATVHGTMLSARAYGDPSIFGVITQPMIERLITGK
ncbi:TetR/AcrR family transcriptional regulator [Pseudomonas putida]|uniref:TetR/AcrR family transcriptional regulator n=1 Tax=Pseudomonas TaxID=286 RepID=UPI0010592935|nr:MULTISPECIES: TetR/AcrR family transcriptional regulator [Pseudomonas]MBF8745121.1 TetR/AcrR family transcriptional regulator [Pseudomonas monteilii]MCT8165793.1 TetR/AcrR family transcriptional regulator [Pseudomonas sp. HD6422]MCT8184802.1 TetR/AcrR family transcriptional regulator [Pseudomonas sp. HD6421]TDJ73482.1 TetR/AcrR family transcriptional regulator [Pseudomonas putida]